MSGAASLTLDPLEILARLCQQIPPPGFHLTRLFGVYAIRMRGARVRQSAGAGERPARDDDSVLKHFNVTFNYALKKMLLIPNREFEAPFEWDMSGMRLEPMDDTALRIESIVVGSRAEMAGLEKDDVVTHVNGRAVSAKEMFEIRKLMKRDGAVLEIEATRAGKPIEVKLELRRLV